MAGLEQALILTIVALIGAMTGQAFIQGLKQNF